MRYEFEESAGRAGAFFHLSGPTARLIKEGDLIQEGGRKVHVHALSVEDAIAAAREVAQDVYEGFDTGTTVECLGKDSQEIKGYLVEIVFSKQ